MREGEGEERERESECIENDIFMLTIVQSLT